MPDIPNSFALDNTNWQGTHILAQDVSVTMEGEREGEKPMILYTNPKTIKLSEGTKISLERRSADLVFMRLVAERTDVLIAISQADLRNIIVQKPEKPSLTPPPSGSLTSPVADEQ